MSDQNDILALDRAGLEAAAAQLRQPPYRARQVERWLYARGAASFAEMTDLPNALRLQLSDHFTFQRPELVQRQVSADGTRKYLWRLADGVTVESVGIPAGDRLTVCFSTQAGCAMGCAFCATGINGLVRSLLPGEMVQQVMLVGEDFKQRVTNVVAMGQGEPFAAYGATLGALRFMNDSDGLGIGARHITVSTCGLIPGIRRFSAEPEQFTLAVSLHSAIQSTRDTLMPGVRSYPLPLLRRTLLAYTQKTSRRVTFEYALIDGVNDTEQALAALDRFCQGLLCHVNIIPINLVSGSNAARSSAARIARFAKVLGTHGTEASIRAERGTDIDAACGQLTQRHASGR